MWVQAREERSTFRAGRRQSRGITIGLVNDIYTV
jgi:hypothetical protein